MSPRPLGQQLSWGSDDDTAVFSTIPARALAWLRRRRAKALRYEIGTCRRANPTEIRLLERAFGRVGGSWSDRVKGVEVSGPSGSLVVVIDFVGTPAVAVRECERLFAVAWYDAFGVRGSTYTGRIVEETAAVWRIR